jgi:glutathione synthase/RimK-type ligase-like ATP-grasp enzyme
MDQRQLPLIYAHNDVSKWGVHFALAAGRKGVRCKLFSDVDEVPEGSVAFVRLNQMKEYRAQGKKIVRLLNEKSVTTVPNAFEAEMYDDKGAQLQVLQAWMPRTYFIQDLDEAILIAGKMDYPIISKSKEGASSGGVRMLKSEFHAVAEAKKAFSGGFRTVYNRKQAGYVIWQDFMPENNCDYRVVITNDKLFGLKRYVRPDVPFASGSGNNEPILDLDDPRARASFELAVKISDMIQTRWMAYDFVFKDDKPYVLEMSSSWSAGPYQFCRMFNRDLEPTDWRGGHMFDCAVELCLDT